MNIKERVSMVKWALSSNPMNYVKEKLSSLFTPIWSEPVKRNTSQWLDLMMKSPRTDPIHKIASDVSVTPYKLLVKNTDPAKEIKKHISLDLLDKPCSDLTITKQILFYLTEVYQLSPAGEAFWVLERNGFGAPSEIYIVPPSWVQMVPTKSIPYFRILPMGNTSYKMIYVDPVDMVWFKKPNLLNPYGRGRGRAEGIGDELETDEYMAKWQKNKFFNGAIPHYVGVMPGADETTIDRAEENWNRKYQGYKNGHKTAFLNWDAKITKLSDTEQEMDYIESRKFLRDACLQHWSMSGELFGILENANRSTIDLAYELYAKNTLSVELKSFDDTLNRQFFPQFDEKLYIEHENVIPADKEFILKQSNDGLKNGGITVDEWRQANGKKPLKSNKGQILYTPLNMIPTDINGSSDIISNAQAMRNDEKPKINKSEDANKRIWKTFDNAAVKYEKKLEKAIKKFFQAQQDSVLENFKKSYKDDISDDPEKLINWKIEDDNLKNLLVPYWIAAAEEGFNAANDLYSFDFEFDGTVQPKLLKWIKANGLERAKGMNQTTKEKLRKALAEGIEAGDSNIKLRDRVSDIYNDAKTSRANLISRTETMTTVNVGTYESYKAAGFKKKKWLTSRDGAVRDTHSAIDGQIKNMDELFTNGLLHPHADGPAKEVCNCRCTLLVVEEDEE